MAPLVRLQSLTSLAHKMLRSTTHGGPTASINTAKTPALVSTTSPAPSTPSWRTPTRHRVPTRTTVPTASSVITKAITTMPTGRSACATMKRRRNRAASRTAGDFRIHGDDATNHVSYSGGNPVRVAFRQSENTRTFFAISFLLAIVLHGDSCLLRSGNVFFGTTLSSNFLLNTITTQHCGCAFGARATYLIAYKDLASPGLTFIFPLLLIAKNLLRS